MLKKGPGFSLRDKRLFEISEVENGNQLFVKSFCTIFGQSVKIVDRSLTLIPRGRASGHEHPQSKHIMEPLRK